MTKRQRNQLAKTHECLGRGNPLWVAPVVAAPNFQRYVETVPVLLPFVPLYTLQLVRVYLE